MTLVVVELILLIRLCLLGVKYWPVDDRNHTEKINETDVSLYIYNQCRTFTLNVIVVASLICGEFLLLGIGFCQQIKQNKTADTPRSTLCEYCFISALVLCPLGLLGLLKFGFSIAMEETKDPKSTDLKHVPYVVFCFCELFNVFLSYIVRIVMLVTTARIRRVWFPKGENQDITTCSIGQLNPRTEAIEVYHNELHKYKERGERAEHLMSPFKIWFLMPWVLYFITTLINPQDILSPWKGSKDAHVFILTRLFYFTYTILKTIELLVQYAFALKMNQYHHEYYDRMRDRQIFKYESKVYQAEASQFVIDYKEVYNFHPMFFGINPRISIDNPLFVLIFVLTIILRISDLL